MKLPLAEKSDYYKGLLVVSRRDRILHERERDFLIRVGEMLDYDRRFCENTLDELLSNAHISRTPVVFSSEIIKECFFRDALRVAYMDGCIHPAELRWLRQAAQANGKSNQWLDSIIREFSEKPDLRDPHLPLEIQNHT